MASPGGNPRCIEPFSLISDGKNPKDSLTEIYRYLPPGLEVIDAYPSTPLQEGLVALSMKQEGAFIPQFICRIPATTDIAKFQTAWQNCVDRNATLRTRFVQTPSSGLTQVVLAPREIKWLASGDLDEYLRRDRARAPDFGSDLLRYAIIGKDGAQTKHFVWTFQYVFIYFSLASDPAPY
jgi:hypothetical protein